MTNKIDNGEYALKLTGPGHTFERKISEEVASKLIAFVLGSNTGELSRGNSGKTSGENQSGIDRTQDQNLTPKQFLAQKKPENNYERVACLAYYLTHHRDTPHFKTGNISKLDTESAHHFTNAALFVQHATTTYHYLSAAGGGMKQITTLGEAVVEAMPDRTKVKAAIEEHKPRGRGVAKRKKAKKAG